MPRATALLMRSFFSAVVRGSFSVIDQNDASIRVAVMYMESANCLVWEMVA